MDTLIQKNFTAYLKTTGEMSTIIAIASFLVGTAFYAWFKLDLFGFDPDFGHGDILIWGFLYVVFATLLNLLVLLNLIILWVSEPDYREYFAIKILIVLCNIPIAIFYLNTLNILLRQLQT